MSQPLDFDHHADFAEASAASNLCAAPAQGDEFCSGLSESSLLQGEVLSSLRLARCSISDEGVCKLAKVLEAVGRWWGWHMGMKLGLRPQDSRMVCQQ